MPSLPVTSLFPFPTCLLLPSITHRFGIYSMCVCVLLLYTYILYKLKAHCLPLTSPFYVCIVLVSVVWDGTSFPSFPSSSSLFAFLFSSVYLYRAFRNLLQTFPPPKHFFHVFHSPCCLVLMNISSFSGVCYCALPFRILVPLLTHRFIRTWFVLLVVVDFGSFGVWHLCCWTFVVDLNICCFYGIFSLCCLQFILTFPNLPMQNHS